MFVHNGLGGVSPGYLMEIQNNQILRGRKPDDLVKAMRRINRIVAPNQFCPDN